MSRQPSRSESFSFRLNPIHPQEAKALEHIQKRVAADHISEKDVIVDALCARAGAQPEMFAPGNSQIAQFAHIIQNLLEDFGQQLLAKIAAGEIRINNEVPAVNRLASEEVSQFTSNFYESFTARNQQDFKDIEEE